MNKFGVRIGEAFGNSVKLFFSNLVPMVIGSVLTLSVYALFRWPAQVLLNDERVYLSLAVDLVGLILAGIVAVPWYTFALRAVRGEQGSIADGFKGGKLYYHQFVASFWFWAGILLGFRYLLGLPSILVLLLYSFHGFIVADRKAKGGLAALGTSVRMTEGKRIGLFAIAGLLIVFNMFGALPIGVEGRPPLAVVGAAVGVVITTSISLLFGAHIYEAFITNVKTEKVPPPP